MEAVLVLLTDLESAISDLGGAASSSIDTFNGMRDTAMKVCWIFLCILMCFEIVVTLLRRLVPEKTDHCACNCTFSTMTAIYIIIMLLVFVVTSVFALVVMVLADVCVVVEEDLGVLSPQQGAFPVKWIPLVMV